LVGKLILVRHGETDKNINHSLHAFGDTEGLNDNGAAQIKITAERLSEMTPHKIYSSKERRALESAKILSEFLKVPVEETDGMEERNWGIFTGKPWEEVKKILDPMTLDERYNYTPRDGESWKVFESRLKKTIRKITTDNLGKSVMVVTHGGAIRALMPYLLRVPKEESFKYDPDNASLTIFDFDKDKFTNIVVNDTTHLKEQNT